VVSTKVEPTATVLPVELFETQSTRIAVVDLVNSIFKEFPRFVCSGYHANERFLERQQHMLPPTPDSSLTSIVWVKLQRMLERLNLELRMCNTLKNRVKGLKVCHKIFAEVIDAS
jgi:hypothetical protein